MFLEQTIAYKEYDIRIKIIPSVDGEVSNITHDVVKPGSAWKFQFDMHAHREKRRVQSENAEDLADQVIKARGEGIVKCKMLIDELMSDV